MHGLFNGQGLDRHNQSLWMTWMATTRVVVNGSVSRWTLVRSSVPQGSVLELVLFSVFISDTDSENWETHEVQQGPGQGAAPELG